MQQLWPKQGTSVTFRGAKSELIKRGIPASMFVDEYAMPWNSDFVWRVVVDTPSGWTLPDRARRLVSATPYAPYVDEDDEDDEVEDDDDKDDDAKDDVAKDDDDGGEEYDVQIVSRETADG